MPPATRDEDERFGKIHDRLAALEQRVAVREETLKGIVERLDKIEAILSKLTWLVIAAIIAAAMAFIIGGGLSNVIPA